MTTSRGLRLGSSVLLLLLGILCIFVAPSLATSPAPSQAESDLICHSSDPQDCYPRIFQPTDDFQKVHDDQQIPGGLHVRLNINTGQKEAKINVPDEIDPSLEGLPIVQDIIVVEQEQDQHETPPIYKNAPKYEPVGKIKGPKHEAGSFAEGMEILRRGVDFYEGHDSFDLALESLEELSHDIYYGLQIVQDEQVVDSLLCLMVDRPEATAEGVTPRDQQAAAILAGALQNNPTALQEVAKFWPELMTQSCLIGGATLKERLYTSFMPTSPDESPKLAANMVKARMAATNGLIRDESIRAEFLRNGGMRQLLEVLIPEEQEWTGAQRKVGQLVLDNFLDEDMGAVLGEWPVMPKLSDKECASAPTTEEGCWDYHAERLMRANKKDKTHWSRDLHGRLAKARKGGGRNMPPHNEL